MHLSSQHRPSGVTARSRVGPVAAGFLVAPLLATGLSDPAAATPPAFDRVSVSGTGEQGDQHSSAATMSGDARYVVFHSTSTDLVPGDTNNISDVFLHDRRAHSTIRVSVSSTGTQADGFSYDSVVSGNGRYVAFGSTATNLVPDDTNGIADVFVHDVQTGTTSRVNVDDAGAQAGVGPGIDGESNSQVTISADGRYVAFHSGADNLVPGDTNGAVDVFVHDRKNASTTRVSVTRAGTQSRHGGFNPALSADGQHIAFLSDSPDLVRGDTNGIGDVFVRDLRTGTNSRVSVSSTEQQTVDGETYRAYVAISANGQFVAFTSSATTLVPDDTNRRYDVFLRDRRAGETHRISQATTGEQADNDSNAPAISGNGRIVAFQSDAGNLTPDSIRGTALFTRDWRAGTTRMIPASQVISYPYASGFPSLSSNGRHIAFAALDSDLVPGDTNNATDVFVGRTFR
jgi:hypothetical protein